MFLLRVAYADERLEQETALQTLATATRLDSYAKYPDFFDILGLAHSNFRSHAISEQGVESPKVLGTGQYVELTSTSKTTLSRAIQAVEFYSVIPLGRTSARMHLSFGLDSHILCIKQSRFIEAFAPLQTVYATDLGPSHLEREFPGPNHRGIGAFFDKNECATRIFFTQDPYR